MNNHISYEQVINRLDENALPYLSMLINSGEARIIIMQRGGRILGPFFERDGESLLWINDAFSSPETFKAFLNTGDWNLGGERVYIGPELQYSVPDRQRFWQSYTLSPEIDPGHYKLAWEKPEEIGYLQQEMELVAYPDLGPKELTLTRLILKAEDPLRNLRRYEELLDGVVYCGYQQRISLTEKKHNSLISQTWDLAQINPGGLLMIPALPDVEVTSYYDPVDETYQVVGEHQVCLRITGDHMFKMGYKAPHIFGRAGYFNHLADNCAYLIVRHYYNHPSTLYLDEPFDKPGCKGDSLQVYQDDGALGGFAEIECIGQPVGGKSHRSTVTDDISLSFYIGPTEKVARITEHLVGVSPDVVLRDWKGAK